MSVFHNTISRRDFMKTLGFAGAGAAALTAPVFHDLDELTSSNFGIVDKPWWLKELPFGQVTMDHDWSLIKRYNPGLHRNSSPQLYTPDWDARIVPGAAALKKKNLQEKNSGYTMRDFALADGCSFAPSIINGKVTAHAEHWFCETGMYTDLKAQGAATWEGTPEENSRMLRSALKYYGSSFVGYMGMDSNNWNLIYTREAGNEAPGHVAAGKRPMVFENVDDGYETADKVVIPRNKPMTWVSYGIPHCMANFQCAPSKTTSGNESLVNLIVEQCGWNAMKFVTELGHFAMKGSHDDLGPKPAAMQFSGIGEISRDAGQLVSWEFGMCFSPDKLMTDLELAPTPPVDAGIQRFCLTCGKCADVCPSGAIPPKGTDPSWEVPGAWSQPGHKQFQNDCPKCGEFNTLSGGCLTCMGTCVFTKSHFAAVHQTVTAVVAQTGVFNSFFAKMDDLFGYGNRSENYGPDNNPVANGVYNPKGAEWWDLELPPHGWAYEKKI